MEVDASLDDIYRAPPWVPRKDSGELAVDVYVAEGALRGKHVTTAVELQLSRTSVTEGHAEWLQPWEFDTCIPDCAQASATGVGLQRANLAAYVDPESLARFRASAVSLRRRKPYFEERTVLPDDPVDEEAASRPSYPLQRPTLSIAFDAFLNNLAQGPTRAVVHDVPLGPAISRSVGRTLEMLFDRRVPTQRAVWFIRVAILNESPKQARPDRAAPSPRALWYKLIVDYIRSELEAIRTLSVPPEAVETRVGLWKYFVNVIRWQADEGLVDDTLVAGNLLLTELRRVLRVDGEVGSLPQGTITYRRSLADAVLYAVERFEPELLANRRSAHELVQIALSALEGDSRWLDPFRPRLGALLRRSVRRLVEIECLSRNARRRYSIQDLGNCSGKDLVRFANQLMDELIVRPERRLQFADSLQLSSRSELSAALTELPWSADFPRVLRLLAEGFQSSAVAVRHVVRWALVGPVHGSPLATITAATVVAEKERLRSHSNELRSSVNPPLYQRAIMGEVYVCVSTNGADSRVAAGLLFELHLKGSFSLSAYLREARTLLTRLDGRTHVHLQVIEDLPEMFDRGATPLRRNLLKRWRSAGKRDGVSAKPTRSSAVVDMNILHGARATSRREAREAARVLHMKYNSSARLTHCEHAVKEATPAAVLSTTAFLIEAGAAAHAMRVVMTMLRNSRQLSDDPNRRDLLRAVAELAPFIAANGELAELLETLFSFGSSDPAATERCIAVTALPWCTGKPPPPSGAQAKTAVPALVLVSARSRCLMSLATLFGTHCPQWNQYINSAILRGASTSVVRALRGEATADSSELERGKLILENQRSWEDAADAVRDTNVLVTQLMVPQFEDRSPLSSGVVSRAEFRALSAGIAPTAAIQWLTAALKAGEDYSSGLIGEAGIGHALLASGQSVVKLLSGQAPRLLRCLLDGHPWSDLDDATVETPVRIATALNSPWCLKWTEIALSSFEGDTLDGATDAAADFVHALLFTAAEQDQLRPMLVSKLLEVPSKLILECTVGESLRQLGEQVEPLLSTPREESEHEQVRRAVIRDDLHCGLLLAIPVESVATATVGNVRMELQAELEKIKTALAGAPAERVMGHASVGGAVTRRVEALMHFGFHDGNTDAVQMIMDLLEVVIPGLNEREVDDVLVALRIAVDSTGRARDEKALRKRVVTSSVHYWFTARQRLSFCALFTVSRGIGGPFRRNIAAFVPSEDSATGRRPVDNWTLLEGGSAGSLADTRSFGVQVGGDFKPARRVKRTYATFACLTR